MCGLCGFVELSGISHNMDIERYLKRMISAMQHRGPDHTAIWFTHLADKTIGLGYCRLAIIDLDPRSNQPFWAPSGDVVLVYDGRIFNYIEIRNQLCRSGVKFRTQSDTEVLLQAYLHWGIDSLEKFRGMWAFVILDLTKGEMICCRDHFGVKPFFYYYDETRFLFASEIKGLLVSGKVPIEPNTPRVYEFIENGKIDYDQETLFKGIYALKPGTILRIDLKAQGSIPLQQSEGKMMEWIPAYTPSRMSDWVHALREELEIAAKLRLRADVPIACSISGGVDSTSIASILSRTHTQKLKTFSCVYKNPDRDERTNISAVVSLIRSEHFNLIYEDNLTGEELIKMLVIQDQPVHTPSVMSQYLIYREMASRGIRVSIDGQGGDELFSGYLGNLVIYYLSLLMRKSLRSIAREAFFILLQRQWSVLMRVLRRALSGAWPSSEGLKGILEKEIRSYTLPHSLRYTDLNSAAHSVESRPGFLDQVLYSMARQIPEELLIRCGKTKFILREAMRDRLPKTVVRSNRKVGLWASNAYYEIQLLRQYLYNVAKNLQSDFVDISKLVCILQQGNEQHIDWNLIWRQFSVAVWETFVLSRRFI